MNRKWCWLWMAVLAVVLQVSGFILQPCLGQVPGILNYQGRVVVNGTNFDGTGQFKFALVNNGASQTYWSNGNNAVSLTVTKGLCSVLLGDTSIANMTYAIPVTVFTNADVRLHVQFNDGVTGFQPLSPDPRLAAVGYALLAANVPDAAITSNKLAAGAVTTSKIANGAVGSAQLASGAVGSGQLAASAVIAPAIANGAVGNSALAASSVTSGKITDGTIIDADISATANIDAGKIGHGDLQATRLKVGSGHTLSGSYATIGGGSENSIQPNADYATIGGGYQNSIQSNAYNTTIGGGVKNSIQPNANNATIGGGVQNSIQPNANNATIGGGVQNSIQPNAVQSTIGGGYQNSIQSNANYATIAGGTDNQALGGGSFIGGGGYDGGTFNRNTASGGGAVVVGGTQNLASGSRSTVGGGHDNLATNSFATVPGGAWNVAGGVSSFAAGQATRAIHDGCFVWGDTSTLNNLVSTAANQFLIRATGGVGINTASPQAALDVTGDLKVSGAYKGTIGPNGGAPFPRPAYDSGWQSLTPAVARDFVLPPELNGDIDDLHVEVNGRYDGWGNPVIHNFWNGHATSFEKGYGACWSLARGIDGTNEVSVSRAEDDGMWQYCRVRVWLIK